MKDIREQKQDRAAILGFSNFVDLSMEEKMAANVENVHSMISCLLGHGTVRYTITRDRPPPHQEVLSFQPRMRKSESCRGCKTMQSLADLTTT